MKINTTTPRLRALMSNAMQFRKIAIELLNISCKFNKQKKYFGFFFIRSFCCISLSVFYLFSVYGSQQL